MTTTLICIPRKFYEDHGERCLPTPEAHRTTARHVFVDINDPLLPELLDDAEYYADERGICPEVRGICRSAKATAKAITAAIKETP